jgi:hypothetical protein
VFAELQQLFYGRCTVGQPIQLHKFRSTAIGNEITQLLTSVHVAIKHNRPLVISPEHKFIWFGTNQQYDLADLFRLSSCQQLYERNSRAWPQSAVSTLKGWAYPGHPAELAHTGHFWGTGARAQEQSGGAFAKAPFIAWWKTMTSFMLRPSDKLLRDAAASTKSDLPPKFDLPPSLQGGLTAPSATVDLDLLSTTFNTYLDPAHQGRGVPACVLVTTPRTGC